MGYKAIKSHFGVVHIVAIYNENLYGGRCICIGSPYCHDIIVISMAGKVLKKYDKSGYAANEDLICYTEALLEASKTGQLKDLIDEQDQFDASLPIYTIKNGSVVLDYCEAYGWPNVTHSGQLMYENTYFKTRKDAYKYLLNDTRLGVRYSRLWEVVKESVSNIWRHVKYLGERVKYWIQARTIGRFIVKKAEIASSKSSSKQLP